MSHSIYVGIDLGGTFIKGGLVKASGEILKETQIPTEADQGPDHVLGRIAALVKELSQGVEIAGVGIGMPGQIDVDKGICHYSPNLPGWEELEVGPPLEKAIGCPVILDNDANVAALGEYAFGAGKGAPFMLMVTLGTGVGGGLIMNGEMVRGAKGLAGEFGHCAIEIGGRKCGCGRRGCIEAYANQNGVIQTLKEKLDAGQFSVLAAKSDPDTRDVFDAAKAGDCVAIDVFRQTGDYLGVALADMANLLNLQRVVVGGGVANAGDYILEASRQRVKQDALGVAAEGFEIVPAQLGNKAGLVGAAFLAMK